METFKPVLQDTQGTNLTTEAVPSADFSDNVFVFAKSLSKLLDMAKEEQIEKPNAEISPIERPLPTPAAPEVREDRQYPQPTRTNSRVDTVIDTSLPTEVKAFLDTIAMYESPDYDVIVGQGMYGAPARFTDYSQHPNVIGMRTVEGPSTAAGRYQFVFSTWQDLQRQYPGQFKDFSPATQDRAAWRYAQDVYKQRTGKDLFEALRSGNIKDVQQRLRKIWIGFGLDKDVAGTYAKALKRYNRSE